jgi:hypothetical protein
VSEWVSKCVSACLSVCLSVCMCIRAQVAKEARLTDEEAKSLISSVISQNF